MPSENTEMPTPLLVVLIALVLLAIWGWSNRKLGWGIPMLGVLATIGAWYVGDYFYNDYGKLQKEIGEEYLNAAWWQVLFFLLVFSALVPVCHRLLNEKLRYRGSFVINCQKSGILRDPWMQKKFDGFGIAVVSCWAGLMFLGLSRVEWNFQGLFFPWVDGKVNPWGRGRIGGGIDALLAFAAYLQIFFTAGSGVILALSRNPRTRMLAGIVFALSIPWYFLDRTRNTMLATLLPGLLAWVFLRFQGTLLAKGVILAGAFLFLNHWMSFVMETRGEGRAVSSAFSEKGLSGIESDSKHEGLNMFEELAWMNRFLDKKTYQPSWGQRYFAEAVNPIPRALWKNKPTIGLDYAIARGQKEVGPTGEVTATISTGMIGQGVANFGVWLGPLAAAFLMAMWVSLLAKDDLLSHVQPGRLMLYASGLILTFNLGRDITLLVLYPYFFGWALFWYLGRKSEARPQTMMKHEA